jgi:hypothetical protein
MASFVSERSSSIMTRIGPSTPFCRTAWMNAAMSSPPANETVTPSFTP